MDSWLNELASWQLGFIVVGSSVIFSVVIQEITYRYFMVRDSNRVDRIALFSSSSGVLYSVFLALITVNAWQDFSDVQTSIEAEAYTIGDLYRDLQGVPGQDSQEMQSLLRTYVNTVLNEEWPAFRLGERNFAARGVLDDLFTKAGELEPHSLGEQTLHIEVLRLLNTVTHNHRILGDSVDESVMPMLWVVVWIGGLLNLAINALSASGRRGFDYFLLCTFAVNIGLVITLIYVLDHPFKGGVHVSNDPYRGALDLMDHLDSRRKGVSSAL